MIPCPTPALLRFHLPYVSRGSNACSNVNGEVRNISPTVVKDTVLEPPLREGIRNRFSFSQMAARNSSAFILLVSVPDASEDSSDRDGMPCKFSKMSDVNLVNFRCAALIFVLLEDSSRSNSGVITATWKFALTVRKRKLVNTNNKQSGDVGRLLLRQGNLARFVHFFYRIFIDTC
jgi:hypothetical protein